MPKNITLESSVTNIPLVGPSKALLLEKLGIKTIKDFLFHIPFKYKDTSDVIPIIKLKELREGTVIAKVEKIENVYTRNRKVFTRAKISDESGHIVVLWFNQTYLVKAIKLGEVYIFEGKLSKKSNDFVSPTYEKYAGDLEEQSHIGKITPFYNETEGISSKWLRSRYNFLKNDIESLFQADLPNEILDELSYLPLSKSIHMIHFPQNFEEIKQARERLAFDEMLKVSIKTVENVNLLKQRKGISIDVKDKDITDFKSKLPYTLTHDQEQSINEIADDLKNSTPMNRLLNGDVGSGKTVVSTIAMYLAYKSGYSSIMLAPTTILASQHYKTLTELLKPFDIEVKLITSNIKSKLDNKPQIIVGTHALLFEKDEIHNLGLLIVDEQHRFGVKQREQLTKSRLDGLYPHYLMMSATPIPHTLTNIMFGDMDVSFIRELPPHRIPIESHFVPNEKRHDCFEWINKRIIYSNCTEQAFVIFPLIEESESLEVKAATKEYERLQKEEFSNLKVGLLHGQMKSKEKDQILEDFKQKKFNVLVSTSVVEVGIDIPDATIMVVEDAQRFGLAQLHQFRGRVGRGKLKSYCFVLAGESVEQESYPRLKYFAEHSSGFDVAEYDLQTRGPGEVYGVKQSGIPSFKVASINDISLLIQARSVANRIIKDKDSLEKLLFV